MVDDRPVGINTVNQSETKLNKNQSGNHIKTQSSSN